MYKALSLSAVAEVICADKRPLGEVASVSTDTRAMQKDCLFVALKGENYDAHDFIPEAFAKGAAYAVAHKRVSAPDERILYVGDTQKAFRRIAGQYRSAMRAKIVAVTGSVGKTTARDMTAAVLASRYNTMKTENNLNNEVGVAQTLLKLGPSHEVGVIEMGMSARGEIEALSLCAMPDAAIITNIGVSHMELLGNRENIYKAKTEITAGLAYGAPLILNGDDEYLKKYKNGDFNIVFYGLKNPECRVMATNIRLKEYKTVFDILYDGKSYPAVIPAMGEHNVLNALAGFAAGVCLGVEPGLAAVALNDFKPTGMRQKIVECAGFTVVEDCYNASPDSMRAAMSTLADMSCKGRRIAVIADMFELGSVTDDAHREAGEVAAKLGIDCVFATGKSAALAVESAKTAGANDVRFFEDKGSLSEFLINFIEEGDIVWFKASRGMKLEEVIKRVYEERKK